MLLVSTPLFSFPSPPSFTPLPSPPLVRGEEEGSRASEREMDWKENEGGVYKPVPTYFILPFLPERFVCVCGVFCAYALGRLLACHSLLLFSLSARRNVFMSVCVCVRREEEEGLSFSFSSSSLSLSFFVLFRFFCTLSPTSPCLPLSVSRLCVCGVCVSSLLKRRKNRAGHSNANGVDEPNESHTTTVQKQTRERERDKQRKGTMNRTRS